ncbi:MAG TPA: PPOX class F420-dependent oxidoreductase, partial [Solirubrobacteraceae bacterium]|nr:PPOX class F420-dependent oxidoreductase [Solirubrobacteraceae bacterium]
LSTFRRDGRAVSTPVWVVAVGPDEVGFYTSSTSGKAKRLAHTPRVTIQACNARGAIKPGSSIIEASARVVTGPELESLRQKVVAKYGFQTKITKFLATLVGRLRGKPFPYADRGVVITLPHGS